MVSNRFSNLDSLFLDAFLLKPGEEYICSFAVGLKLRIVLVFGFEEWNSTDESNQQSNHNWTVNCGPSIAHRTSNEPNAPPKDRLSEVVRMSRVLPKARVDKFRLCRVFICHMCFELLISDPLKNEPEKPHKSTQDV